MTSTVALIGHPVSHSISPRFQQAAFDAAGIDARYEAWDVLPEDIGVTLERLRSGSMLGANVTISSNALTRWSSGWAQPTPSCDVTAYCTRRTPT